MIIASNAVSKECRDLAADIRDWNGKTMTAWDQIRHQVETLKGSDLPRMNFESLIENFAEALDKTADEIDRLNAVVAAPLSSEEMRLIDKHCDWVAFGHAWNAVMKHRKIALDDKRTQDPK